MVLNPNPNRVLTHSLPNTIDPTQPTPTQPNTTLADRPTLHLDIVLTTPLPLDPSPSPSPSKPNPKLTPPECNRSTPNPTRPKHYPDPNRPSPRHRPQKFVATGVRGGRVHPPCLKLDKDGVRLPPVQELGSDYGTTRRVRPGPPVLLHRVLTHLTVGRR